MASSAFSAVDITGERTAPLVNDLVSLLVGVITGEGGGGGEG